MSPPPDEPDFSPANINFEGNLEEGQDVTIYFEILNLGKTSGTIDYELMVDGETVYNGNEQINSESSKSLSYIWTAVKGTHTIKIKLDNSDPIETTEDNNVVFSCGSGVTASVLALAYSLINNKYTPTIYDGSWSEYGLVNEKIN